MTASRALDAVVVGAGPNGLAAAVTLALAGRSVLVVEAADTIGGGTRTEERTLPGFRHDVCSAVHPMGLLSPFLRTLPLAEHGLTWCAPELSVAHPLDRGRAVVLRRSVDETARGLGVDGPAWARLVNPLLRYGPDLMGDLMAPLRWPRHPVGMARFGLRGLRSARSLCRRFRGDAARALFAGLAGHAILPLERAPTAAVGLVFALAGHLVDWPCARGGSATITQALASLLGSLGGRIRTGAPVRTLADLPPARAVLLDVSPRQALAIAGDALPAGYRRRLGRYRYGPGVFKLDYALDGPIPWRASECAGASTVHVGGTFEEIAASERDAFAGRITDRPFLIVCQQSHFDPTRAPAGRHTGYAYCHVPHGCTADLTEAVEAQIERFAPGFRDRILARRSLTPADLERHDANLVGGVIAGGVADLGQLFTRPVARWDPYATPNPRLFLCSASTPPGGGVHGMCGWWAARSALRRVLR